LSHLQQLPGRSLRGKIYAPKRDKITMATEEELKRALKAFKKRLKLTRLDDESGLSRGGGKTTGIMGITPPSGHPPGIWDELVAQGKLKREMSSTYSLVSGK
jgi:hypothetical protein